MNFRFSIFSALIAAAGIPSSAFADFVPDEFDGQTTLGAHWTWNPGITDPSADTTSTLELSSTHLLMTVAEGADQTWHVDKYAYIEQDQPDAALWEVVTKIDNWDPREEGNKLAYQKIGLALHEDENHWIMVTFQGNSAGTSIGWYGLSQFDPGAVTSTANQYKSQVHTDPVSGTFNPIYLRLRKTSKGYIGAYSTDETTWTEMTSYIRNPHTADGTLPNGKIRIIQGGGNTWNQATKNADTAEIDWIRMNSLAPATAGFVDDQFDGTELGSTWVYGQGTRPGTLTVEDGKVKMLHANGQDLGPGFATDRAQLIMQDAPTDAEYSLVTKVGTTPGTKLTDGSKWEGHGIRLWQDQNHWLQVSVTRNSADFFVDARHVVETRHESDDGTSVSSRSIVIGDNGDAAAPEYLRIDKNGAMVRALYSFDGFNWVVAGNPDHYEEGWIPLTEELRNAQVQLFTKRPLLSGTSSGNLAKTSEFDFIQNGLPTAAGDWQLFE